MKFKKWLDSREKQTEGFNPFSKLFKKQAPIPAPVAPLAKPKQGMSSNDFQKLIKSIHGSNDVTGEPEEPPAPSQQPSSHGKVIILMSGPLNKSDPFVIGVYRSLKEAIAASADYQAHYRNSQTSKIEETSKIEAEFEGTDVPNGSPVYILWDRYRGPVTVYSDVPRTYNNNQVKDDVESRESDRYFYIEKKINHPPGIGPDHSRWKYGENKNEI